MAEEPPRNVRNGSLTARDVARRRAPARAPGPGRRGCARRRATRSSTRSTRTSSARARRASRAAPWASFGRRTPRCRGRRGRFGAHRGARRRFAPLRRGPGGAQPHRDRRRGLRVGAGADAAAGAAAPRARPARSRGGRGRAAPHGFIIRETGQEDLFVHESGLGAGLAGPRTGDRVTFRVGRAPDGRDTAVDVSDGRGAGGAGGTRPARAAGVDGGGGARCSRDGAPGEPATAGATHASHRATQHEVEAVAQRSARRASRRRRAPSRSTSSLLDSSGGFERTSGASTRVAARAWAYAESTLVTLDRSRRVVGVRDDAGAAAEARARQRGRERRAYYGPAAARRRTSRLARSVDASRRRELRAARAGAVAARRGRRGRGSHARAGGVAPVVRARAARAAARGRSRAYAPPPKAEQVPPTYSSSFFSAPPPPPPPAPPVHSGGSSASEFEARVVSAGLARILPDLKKEEICDLDTLCSLREDDLKELGLAVGARVKLMRLIRSVQADELHVQNRVEENLQHRFTELVTTTDWGESRGGPSPASRLVGHRSGVRTPLVRGIG